MQTLLIIPMVVTAVMSFLAGTVLGIIGMYLADSKYIRIITKAYKEKEKIYKNDCKKKSIEITDRKKEIDDLNNTIDDLQFRLELVKTLKEDLNA